MTLLWIKYLTVVECWANYNMNECLSCLSSVRVPVYVWMGLYSGASDVLIKTHSRVVRVPFGAGKKCLICPGRKRTSAGYKNVTFAFIDPSICGSCTLFFFSPLHLFVLRSDDLTVHSSHQLIKKRRLSWLRNTFWEKDSDRKAHGIKMQLQN